MHVVVLTEQWFPDFTGGSGRVATDTALALGRLGWRVSVIAPRLAGAPAVSKPGVGVTLHRIAARTLFPQTWTDPIMFSRALNEASQGDGPDVVLSHQPSGSFAAHRVLPEVPCVNVFHASAYREALHRRGLGVSPWEAAKSRSVEWVLRLLERRNLDRVSKVLVLSEFSRSLIAADAPRALPKVRIAGGGVDVERLRPAVDREALRRDLGIVEGTSVVLTVRRLVARTGVDMLLEAFSLMNAEAPQHLRLVVIGDGERRQTLEHRAAGLGIAGNVEFLGRVSDEDVLRWYQAADVFALPTVAYEGFGMSTAEALSCGTPAVGTPVGATGEILRPLNPTWISRSADPADFAEALSSKLHAATPAEREACREYALRELSIDVMAQRWSEVLSEVASNAARGT